MSGRDTDDDERPAAAVIPAGAGPTPPGAGPTPAKGLGDPGAAKGLGDPGGAKGLSDPGAAKGLGDPGGAKGLGNPGGAKGLGDPGAAKGLGAPSGAKGLGDPGGAKGLGNPGGAKGLAGPGPVTPQLGPVYAPPGIPQPGFAPPPFPQSGFPPPGIPAPRAGISIKGILIAVAAVVAAVVLAIVGFFVLRPDQPQRTAEQPGPPAVSLPATGAPPGAVTASGALFRGTYSSRVTVVSRAGTSTKENLGTATSDCPQCDVTLTASGTSTTFRWNGNGWEQQTTGPTCAGDTITFTPIAVADGFVQELSYYYATCNGTVSSGTMTRVGD